MRQWTEDKKQLKQIVILLFYKNTKVLTDELILKTQMVAGEDWKHALTIMGFRKDIISNL